MCLIHTNIIIYFWHFALFVGCKMSPSNQQILKLVSVSDRKGNFCLNKVVGATYFNFEVYNYKQHHKTVRCCWREVSRSISLFTNRNSTVWLGLCVIIKHMKEVHTKTNSDIHIGFQLVLINPDYSLITSLKKNKTQKKWRKVNVTSWY